MRFRGEVQSSTQSQEECSQSLLGIRVMPTWKPKGNFEITASFYTWGNLSMGNLREGGRREVIARNPVASLGQR